MHTTWWHRALAVVITVAGIALFVYGVGYHMVPILVPPKPAPAPAKPEPSLEPPATEQPAAEQPGIGIPGIQYPETCNVPPEPKPDTKPDSQPKLVTIEIPEREVVRDTTVDGLVRLESGEIKRTYGDKPPAACPT